MKDLTHIFLDLDGPLLDGKERHYFCYQQILKASAHTPLEIEQYWNYKKACGDLRGLLKMSGAEEIFDSFLTAWLSLIESPEALAFDKVQSGAIENLTGWKERGINLVLVTMRKQRQALYRQLDGLKLRPLLNAVLICEHDDGGRGKAAAVQELHSNASLAGRAVWIGDTEVDWEAAQTLGCRVVLVSNGLRDEACLQSLNGAVVVPSIASVEL